MTALPQIPAADARRIVASMARLRSPHDGEVIAAARAVSRLLAPHGVYLEALAQAALCPPARAITERPPQSESARADWCLQANCWNATEREFLAKVTWLATLSPKQRAWLDRLCARRGREA